MSLYLYCVQDAEYPMWVVATGWDDAVSRWKAKINEDGGICDDEPEWVQLLCDSNSLLLYSDPTTQATVSPQADNSTTVPDHGHASQLLSAPDLSRLAAECAEKIDNAGLLNTHVSSLSQDLAGVQFIITQVFTDYRAGDDEAARREAFMEAEGITEQEIEETRCPSSWREAHRGRE